MLKMPHWDPPEDMAQALVGGEGIWEDERWSPILLTAMSGSAHQGRAIPIVWQIEFDPTEEACERANASLAEMGVEPDGYGWGEFIRSTIRGGNSGLAERLHITDCERGTCVVWVESEDDCRMLLEATWQLFFASDGTTSAG